MRVPRSPRGSPGRLRTAPHCRAERRRAPAPEGVDGNPGRTTVEREMRWRRRALCSRRAPPPADSAAPGPREPDSRAAALAVPDADHDAPEPGTLVVRRAAHDDGAVRSCRHGQADRAQEHPGEAPEPALGIRTPARRYCVLVDQSAGRVLVQHLARQPCRGSTGRGTFRGGADHLGCFAVPRRRVQEVEWHLVQGRLVSGPVHRLKARLGPVDAYHQGRHRPCRLTCPAPRLRPAPSRSTCAAEKIGVLLEGENTPRPACRRSPDHP